MWWLFIPFVIQAIAMSFDEYVFHIKRDLPKWERMGHPLDTLTVLICFFFVYFVPYSSYALKWYIALALFSCIFVTKDEFVHKHHCEAKEQWLHAFLFLNHPVILAALGIMWLHFPQYKQFVVSQIVCISLFCFYQIVYWNFIRKLFGSVQK